MIGDGLPGRVARFFNKSLNISNFANGDKVFIVRLNLKLNADERRNLHRGARRLGFRSSTGLLRAMVTLLLARLEGVGAPGLVSSEIMSMFQSYENWERSREHYDEQ